MDGVDDVTGLLAAQGETALKHLLQNVAVAHTRLDDADAVLAHRQDEPEIAHDGHDERVGAERAVGLHAHGEQSHDLVAVHEVALGVDGEAAVGVPVVSHTHVGTDGAHVVLELLGMGGAAVGVDVEAVRGGVDRDDLGSGGAQGGRADVAGGAVGGVHDDPQSRQIGGDGVDEVVDVVLVGDRLALDDAAHARPGRQVLDLAQQGLDLVLDGVLELVAAAGEELDAVVLEGVVRGGDHDAQVDVLSGGQVGDGRGGKDADTGDVDAGGGQTRTNGVVEKFAAGARVAPDDGARAPGAGVVGGRVLSGQDAGCGLAELDCEGRREQIVGQAPHPVGAEESCHERIPPVR